MDGSIVLGSSQRKRLLAVYRRESVDPQVRLRAHIILLLSEGRPWSLIAAVLFCSTATIARWKARFESGGVEALPGRGPRPDRDAARRVGGAAGHLGQDAHAARLRVLPQPLVLRDAGGRAARHPPRQGERRDGPSDAAPPEPGVASAAPGARADRRATPVEAAEDTRIAEGP